MRRHVAPIGAAHVYVGALLVSVAALAAGCGGASSPKVASLGGSTSPTSTGGTTTPATGQQPGGSGGGAGGLRMQFGGAANGRQFSACMRSHGVPNFPDPGSSGAIQIGSGSGLDPGSPKFQSAVQTCRSKLPGGGQPTPQQAAKAKAAAIAFSKCMRSHGIHDFPDPTFSGDNVRISLNGGPGSDLDPNAPAFKAAQTACAKNLPGLGGGSTSGG
jgi:hypothetical protein